MREASLVAKVSEEGSLPRLCPTAMHAPWFTAHGTLLGTFQYMGSRLIMHHGRGAKPCPFCEESTLIIME